LTPKNPQFQLEIVRNRPKKGLKNPQFQLEIVRNGLKKAPKTPFFRTFAALPQKTDPIEAGEDWEKMPKKWIS